MKVMAPKRIKRGDTMADIQSTDIVQLSKELLDSVVRSTSILEMEGMGPEDLQQAKLVLGFLNATTATMKTKMQFFAMTDLEGKYAAVKERSEKVKQLK